MATQYYSTPTASRNLINTEFEMLKRIEMIQVAGKFGDQKEQPERKTDTAVFRRLDPFAVGSNGTPTIVAANFISAEGTTPNANTISYTDVPATLENFSILMKFSSKAELMYEENIPEDMRTVCADTLGEVIELVALAQAKAGVGVVYSNGSTRAGLNTRITLPKLQLAARSMENNRAMHVSTAIEAGPKFNTSPVEPAFVVICPTDSVSDVKALSDFTKRVEYGSSITPLHPREFGACDQFRFISTPLLKPYLTAGSATTNGMVATAGSVDVYPYIILAQSALGHISLKGKGMKTSISARMISSKEINHANPSGKFGFVSADLWYNCVRLNENFMTRIEAGVTDLAL